MKLHVTFGCTEQGFPTKFESDNREFAAQFGSVNTVTVGAEDYAGSYEVTPKVDSQTLPTEKRIMKQDLIVKEIPCYAVSNQFGQTIVIGGS